VVAAPDAVAHHRGAATSAALGNFGRGVLFERNALRVFLACADDEHRAALGQVVLLTFLHRLVAFAEAQPELGRLLADPFGEGAASASFGQRWRQRLAERGLLGAARHAVARLLLGPRAGRPRIDDGFLLMQLRAARGVFAGLGDIDRRRLDLQQLRVRSDREIMARFPRLVVPTYAGDEELFASEAFRALLPATWPLDFKRLDEILHPDLLHGP
jgi:hypothetical protein